MTKDISLAGKKRGRPSSGIKKGVLYLRLPADKIDPAKALVSDFISGKLDGYALGKSVSSVISSRETDELKSNNWRLVEENERLTKELEEEKAKVVRALELDLDEKGKLGWRLYFKLKNGTKSEFDQE